MDGKDKKVIVAGTGKSGIAAAKLLLQTGAKVLLFDENRERNIEDIRNTFKEQNADNLSIILGELKEQDAAGADFMVISPGIPVDAAFTELFRRLNIPIWSEVELAYQFGKGRIAAITGTNGKTTTTTLVGEIMKAYYDSVFVVGNIGTPYTEASLLMVEDTVTVAEISSFQLETIVDFKPEVSAVLNVTPDHLNRHHTMEIYADTKQKVAMNQTKEQYCVLNYDDQITRAMADKIPAKAVFFSRLEKLSEGVCLDGDEIILNQGGISSVVCKTSELKLLGAHNIENVMAAVAISYYMKVPLDVIRSVVTEFRAVEHRIEYVDTIGEVDYYNDSKGTNPDAAIKGIEAMVKPTLLIGGGYDKGVEFDDWIEAFNGKVRYLVLIGDTAGVIAETAKQHGFNNIMFAGSLKEAVEICADNARPGDAVLLSPACASWDMFKSYEQRGELFKEYVRALKE